MRWLWLVATMQNHLKVPPAYAAELSPAPGVHHAVGAQIWGAVPLEICLLYGHTDAMLGHAQVLCEPPSMLCCNFPCQGMTVHKEDVKCVFSGCSSDLATKTLTLSFLQATAGPLNCLFLLFLRASLWCFCAVWCQSAPPPCLLLQIHKPS